MSRESTLEQWGELNRHVILHKFPILPKPLWGQDVAFVAFVIDNLVAQKREIYDMLPPCPTCGGTQFTNGKNCPDCDDGKASMEQVADTFNAVWDDNWDDVDGTVHDIIGYLRSKHGRTTT